MKLSGYLAAELLIDFLQAKQFLMFLIKHDYVGLDYNRGETRMVPRGCFISNPSLLYLLYKKVSKQKEAMLDGSKRRQNHGSCSTTRWLGVVYRYIFAKKSLQLQQAERDVECTTLGPRKLLSICRSRCVAQLALSRLQNPA